MREFMAHFVFPAVAVILSVPFVAISYNAAAAQERGTCSQARSQCGTQPVCQRRYQACMETGCWTVGPLKRCGYLQQGGGSISHPRNQAQGGSLTPKCLLPTAW